MQTYTLYIAAFLGFIIGCIATYLYIREASYAATKEMTKRNLHQVLTEQLDAASELDLLKEYMEISNKTHSYAIMRVMRPNKEE